MTQNNVLDNQSEDRRHSARVSFDTRIGVTELTNDTVPTDDQFRPVKSVDLSQTGISFLTTEWPTADQLLVRLSERDQPVHVTAQIVSCRRDNQDGESNRFEVRCEFVDWK